MLDVSHLRWIGLFLSRGSQYEPELVPSSDSRDLDTVREVTSGVTSQIRDELPHLI